MKKMTTVFLVAIACSALALGILAGCNGSGSNKSSSATSSSTSSSAASSSTASSTASSNATSSAASSSASTSSSAVINIDGVDIKDIGVDMVGQTPNLMIIFSNSTDKNVDIDCSKFEVKKDDGTVINFGNSTKTIEANKPYTQWAFTAKSGSLSKGDKVEISYDGTSLGTFEVTEF